MGNTPFLTMFPCCSRNAEKIPELEKACVLSCTVNERERRIEADVSFSALPGKAEICNLENCIRDYYCLSSCVIRLPEHDSPDARNSDADPVVGEKVQPAAFSAPAEASALAEDPVPAELPSVPCGDPGNVPPASAAEISPSAVPEEAETAIPATLPIPPEVKQMSSAPKPSGTGTVLMGRPLKQSIIPMRDITVESGKVAIEGDVVSVESRQLQKRGSAVLCFDITDKTNSFRVSKFLRNTDDQSIIEKIAPGDHLTVYGDVIYSKFDDDTIIDPRCIVKGKKKIRTDDAEEKRIELHLHTRFSALDALTDPAAVVERAAYWGMPAIAVTDHGVAQAFPDMWKAGKKYGVKIIYGLEAYFVHAFPADASEAAGKLRKTEFERSHHMVLLVKNRTGLKNLYYLISQSYLKYYHRNPQVPEAELDSHREGLIVGSACGMGELYSAVVSGESDEKLEEIASYYDYLEIQPLPNNGFLIEDGRAKNEEAIRDWNRKIYQIGKKLGKPVVAASDVHFLDPEDEEYRRILLASKKFADADKDCPIYFRNTDEMLKEFDYFGEDIAKEIVIDNPRKIAELTEEIELLPKDLFPPKIENSAEQLRELVYTKMHRIYGDPAPRIVQERVDIELNTILDHHYDVIYMSAQKLVQNSLEHGYLVGSRGSVGSSMVAYMSGITEVNALPPHYVCPECKYSEFITDGSFGCGADMPEKKCPVCGVNLRRDGFNIPFETFLGFPGNEKTPDIDLNFSGEYQANAHKYTETLFGSDHVFRAGTIGTLAEKTAYGYVKKYLEEHGRKETKAEENRLSLGLVGIKRTTGQHPGGLVIIPQDMDVTDFCPVQHPADDPTSGIITTHFEYHCMEANLLKLDELGHDDPTMIRMMEDITKTDAKEILLSDPETMSIFTSPAALGLPEDDPIIGGTGTIGVPEFGTAFTRQMLIDTKPKQFDTLVRLSGFSHGTDVWAGNIRDLVTGGIATVNEAVGCRDDIMIYLIQKGMEPSLAFKTMEAVRKGKVKKSGSFPGDSEEQMKNMDVPEWWIESCRKIAYLFPKAHAVAYVMMAFRIAWYKVHEPLAFYSAYFYRRSQKGEFDAELMTGGTDAVRRKINEFRRRSNLTNNEEDLLVTMEAVYEFNMRGFEFAPIDVYKADAIKFLITEDGKLMPPFVSISGLGESAAQDLASCRSSEETFVSIEEIALACPKVSASHIEVLKRLGAFGDLPETSQLSLFDMF